MLKIAGEHTFQAPRQTVWDALLDPDVLLKVLPGCDSMEVIGENRFRGAMNIRIGPVQGKFEGSVELSDLDEPNHTDHR